MLRKPRVNYDEIAHLYDAQPYRAREPDAELLAFAHERLDLAILDIGCGTGNQLIANRTALPQAWPSIWAGGLISSSRPNFPRPRSASSTANWSPSSGRPLPRTCWATSTSSSTMAATATILPKAFLSPPPAPARRPGARPADPRRAQHQGRAVGSFLAPPIGPCGPRGPARCGPFRARRGDSSWQRSVFRLPRQNSTSAPDCVVMDRTSSPHLLSRQKYPLSPQLVEIYGTRP